ncbi:MAG: valine--tRNA ligase [Nanoarchaeota archaeon]
MELPKQYDSKVAEPKWQKFWKENKVYKFDSHSSKKVYSIDTPPPYASADHLHVGHGMHYSQFEFVARFQRMRGKNVFFPMGYDDNGLPTERYVEQKHKVDKSKISRADFIKLCLEETRKTGQTYYNLFTRLGFSLDWDLLYHTIGDKARRIAQKSFLDLYKKGYLDYLHTPAMWCTKCQTTVAQAELENVDLKSHFNDLVFRSGGNDLIIATTRPELLPACVALFYHPEDERYQKLKGRFAQVPLFNYEVPILSDESVAKDKGTGLMMVCTFGDKDDIEKWHKYNLPLRVVVTEEGCLNELAGKYKGLNLKNARQKIIADLKDNNLLVRQEEIIHAVNVHERCSTEIEFLKKPQWSIKVLDKKEELIEIAQEIKWYPEHMKIRYEHWVKNLQWNWSISRQRYYGVPFPLWYCKKCKSVLLPEEKELPVDPREQNYPGRKCKCGSSQFKAETDVMDTWMTSSLTPEINADWGGEEERRGFLPMSLRPQAHDIIRTWAFYTIVKSYYHHNSTPWKEIMISGHGQDSSGQKMSKSRGNFIIAEDVIQKYSADAFRFWAASVKLGDDLPFQEKDVFTGQKFVTKLWNASKFSFMHLQDYDVKENYEIKKNYGIKENYGIKDNYEIKENIEVKRSLKVNKTNKSIEAKNKSKAAEKNSEIFDRWLLSKLHRLIKTSTETFERYEYSRTKADVENFFWHTFCDQYLEIVKDRLYNPGIRGKEARKSAQQALFASLQAILKMMAPIMPHITEEIYQLYFAQKEGCKSIHISSWPQYDKDLLDENAELCGDLGADIINAVRKYKSEQQLSLKEEFSTLILNSKEAVPGSRDANIDFRKMIMSISADLKAVLRVKEIVFKGETSLKSEKFSVRIGLVK